MMSPFFFLPGIEFNGVEIYQPIMQRELVQGNGGSGSSSGSHTGRSGHVETTDKDTDTAGICYYDT